MKRKGPIEWNNFLKALQKRREPQNYPHLLFFIYFIYVFDADPPFISTQYEMVLFKS